MAAWRYARRKALVFSGRIQCSLVVFLLVAALLRLEQEVVGRSAASYSANKALTRGGSLDWRGGNGVCLLLRWRGANWEEGHGDAAVDGSRQSRGRSELQIGDLHIVAMASHYDLWLIWQPLQTPQMAFVQPPVRRPCNGFLSAFSVLAAPSGVVPGGSEDGRRWSPGSTGGGEGPDRVSCHQFRVLSGKLEECFVIFYFSGLLCKLYPHLLYYQ